MPTDERSDETRQEKPSPLVIDFHPKAEIELIEAARFYEERESGLGEKLLDSVDASLEELMQNPLIGAADASGRRKWPIHRFPHLLIYRIEANHLYILAVAHTSRKPGYWVSRDSLQAKAIEALDTIQHQSLEKGTDSISMDEIDAEIKAVRQKHRK